MKKLRIKTNSNNLLDSIEKQQKKVGIDSIDIFDFEGSLDRLINMLTEIKNQSKEFNDISVSIEMDHDGDETYVIVNIMGTREETDEEYDIRVNKNLKKELNNFVKNSKNNKEEEKIW